MKYPDVICLRKGTESNSVNILLHVPKVVVIIASSALLSQHGDVIAFCILEVGGRSYPVYLLAGDSDFMGEKTN